MTNTPRWQCSTALPDSASICHKDENGLVPGSGIRTLYPNAPLIMRVSSPSIPKVSQKRQKLGSNCIWITRDPGIGNEKSDVLVVSVRDIPHLKTERAGSYCRQNRIDSEMFVGGKVEPVGPSLRR